MLPTWSSHAGERSTASSAMASGSCSARPAVAMVGPAGAGGGRRGGGQGGGFSGCGGISRRFSHALRPHAAANQLPTPTPPTTQPPTAARTHEQDGAGPQVVGQHVHQQALAHHHPKHLPAHRAQRHAHQPARRGEAVVALTVHGRRRPPGGRVHTCASISCCGAAMRPARRRSCSRPPAGRRVPCTCAPPPAPPRTRAGAAGGPGRPG